MRNQKQPPPAVEVRNLAKSYPGGVRALDDVSFSAPSGTVYALLGRNGAGKSTTVRILTTLTRADGGEARVAGLDVSREAAEVRKVIGCVGQRSSADPVATGRENLELMGRLHGMRGPDLRRRVDELLTRFDLGAAAGRRAGTWSGGMQRKLDLALGLIHRPSVLFLDEPTTGLDPEARAALWQVITGLTRDEGCTVLLTTHYLEEADRLAQTVAFVESGRIVAEGSPEALKADLAGRMGERPSLDDVYMFHVARSPGRALHGGAA